MSIDALAERIHSAESVAVLTGAGISTPSGIPDFRSPGTGMWANVDPMSVAHIDVLRNEPETFWAFYAERFATLGSVRPNRAHEVLVELESSGLVSGVITQNVDRLHFAAGTRELIELHGSIQTSFCVGCGAPADLDEVRELVAASSDGVPRCLCGEMIRPGVVLFGEMLPEKPLRRAVELATMADLILCIGSSLEVQPAAGLPLMTKQAGGEVAIFTQGTTPVDPVAEWRFGGDVVDELEALLAAVGASAQVRCRTTADPLRSPTGADDVRRQPTPAAEDPA